MHDCLHRAWKNKKKTESTGSALIIQARVNLSAKALSLSLSPSSLSLALWASGVYKERRECASHRNVGSQVVVYNMQPKRDRSGA